MFAYLMWGFSHKIHCDAQFHTGIAWLAAYQEVYSSSVKFVLSFQQNGKAKPLRLSNVISSKQELRRNERVEALSTSSRAFIYIDLVQIKHGYWREFLPGISTLYSTPWDEVEPLRHHILSCACSNALCSEYLYRWPRVELNLINYSGHTLSLNANMND